METRPPDTFNAPVVAWATIGAGVRYTGNTKHSVNGTLLGPAAGLVICRTTDDNGFFLLYCDSAWQEIADTWHESIARAKAQAEYENEGITSHWNHAV